uniref:Putative reverse transcriptase, RNA-dependent DNA polymerase, Gag-polypeptide of LTR copia-type n=1 Tax=Tanacetum cinerariifolium TaxID=118510 RepID=A0A6L2K569_TANCI|nr:putative reverse transcriptase, RNA-dependent DNA polymerase, Gag-polypeptide of LTR copia-type [Tanacetum cinerariifolium]
MVFGESYGSTVLINNLDTDYYHRLNSLWREFDALTKLSKCVCEVKCSCDASKELCLHRDPLPKVKDAYTTLSREESHRRIPETSSATELKMSSTSFVAKPVNNSRRVYNNNNNSTRGSNNNNMNRGPNPNLVCENFDMIGHTSGRCYEIIRYPPCFKKVSNLVKQNGSNKQNFNANFDFKNSDKQSSTSVSSLGFTSEQMQEFLSLINDNATGRVNANMAGFEKRGLGDWLGHPFNQILSVLQSDLNITNNCCVPVCEVCHRVKQTRDPFPLYDHKAKGLGELIHLDLWGLYRVHSREGFKYFLTVVNDYSRVVWFYLVKAKDEVFDVMRTLVSDLGIIHQSVCAHTPQQNGIAEKKHKHLLNVARSLMFQGEFLSGLGVFSNQMRCRHLVQGSSRQSKLPAKLNDYVISSSVRYGIEKFVYYSKLSESNMCFATNLNKPVKPSFYEDAMRNTKWIDDMNNEIEALNRNNTWTVCDLPYDRKVIGCKWISKIKYKSTGETDGYKARLIAKGFNQREWLDYEETFSPVVKMMTIKCLISIIVNKN